MPIMKEVSKEEFEEFVANYPRLLEGYLFKPWTPPHYTYNDNELASQWPAGMVASFECGVPGEFYGWDYVPIYRIMINFEECFNSKINNKLTDGEI